MMSKKIYKLLLIFLSLQLLAGCAGSPKKIEQKKAEEKTVTLRILTMGEEPTNGMDSFYQQLDQMTREDLGCIVRFTYIPWGNEKQEIDSAIASGEYDIYCNGVFSNYREKAAKNAFLDLKPYLGMVPELTKHYEQLDKAVLEECEMNGKLYGLPQLDYKTSVRNGIFLYREELCDKWGIEKVTDLDSMEQYLYTAKATDYQKHLMITDNRIWECLFIILGGSDYLEITSIQDMPYAVIDIENPKNVVCRMETEAFKKTLLYVSKWYRDGIIDSDILGVTDNEANRAIQMLLADQKPCETNSTLSAVEQNYIPILYEKNPQWQWNFYYYSEKNPVYRCSLSNDTCTSISSKCLYPEKAIQFIELAHTNENYYDLLRYGVEGINYEKKDGKILYENISSKDRYTSWTGLSDLFMEKQIILPDEHWNTLVENFQKEHVWKEMTVGDHPLNGFELDYSNINKEELDKAWNVYMKPLVCGVTKDWEADYEIAMEKMYEAGLNEYIEEVQKQVSAYYQSKEN